MSARRPAPSESRAATFFLLLGCFTVLGVTFTVGLYSGRHWPGLLPSIGVAREAAKSVAGKPAAGRPGLPGAGIPGARVTEPPPLLTFYQELTAPLTAPPPATKPRPAERPARAESVPERTTPTDDDARAESARPEAPSPARRFTVQAGAFRTREQAEAIRSKLAAAGHEAFIAEVDGSVGARYRVRSGAFSSRDEARRAAERVGAVLKLPTYVTIR